MARLAALSAILRPIVDDTEIVRIASSEASLPSGLTRVSMLHDKRRMAISPSQTASFFFQRKDRLEPCWMIQWQLARPPDSLRGQLGNQIIDFFVRHLCVRLVCRAFRIIPRPKFEIRCFLFASFHSAIFAG